MKDQNKIDNAVIAFHLGRHKLSPNDKSFMNLGGTDSNAYEGRTENMNCTTFNNFFCFN